MTSFETFIGVVQIDDLLVDPWHHCLVRIPRIDRLDSALNEIAALEFQGLHQVEHLADLRRLLHELFRLVVGQLRRR